jgi:hypothetical protein
MRVSALYFLVIAQIVQQLDDHRVQFTAPSGTFGSSGLRDFGCPLVFDLSDSATNGQHIQFATSAIPLCGFGNSHHFSSLEIPFVATVTLVAVERVLGDAISVPKTLVVVMACLWLVVNY